MSSPPFAPKPKTAVPSHLLNGPSQLHPSPRDQERQSLASSIKSSYERKVDPDLPESLSRPLLNDHHRPLVASQDNATATTDEVASVSLREAPRDPRDDLVPSTSSVSRTRPASPYTLNPPIDFDGLSWPSKHLAWLGKAANNN